MAVSEKDVSTHKNAKQVLEFKSGNEMAAKAAAQINYHIMGYFPITPSTEVAQILDTMRNRGETDIRLIPADGEHGAAGINYGASLTGARAFTVTSANGLMYMLEQLPVQSGTRFPMVMNLATRAISGPLDIRGDHSDLYFALNTGWVILTASTPQAVYDLNIMALKVAEHKDVRLPILVAYDGFFTSHQKRNVYTFSDSEIVRNFVGEKPADFPTVIDPAHPITVGAHMLGDDLMNNRYQLSTALDKAGKVFDSVAIEYEAISGRRYQRLNMYKMEDAEIALFLVNSAYETAKDTVDELRTQGTKAGLISPNMIRPFPRKEIQAALKNVKALLVGERADSYGAGGANLTHEIKSALQEDGENQTLVLSRIYGMGGKDFYPEDAKEFFRLTQVAAEAGFVSHPFDYYGVRPGDATSTMKPVIKPMFGDAFRTNLIQVTENPEIGKLKVKIPPFRHLMVKPKRLASGHGACPGCGIFSALELFYKGIEGDVVTLMQTGCGYVTSASYPFSSHKQTFIHNLFQNGPATLSGTIEAFFELKARGEIHVADDFTFVMVSGDGGMDIGMGSAIGTALRGHKMIILEYDNEGYMNTGSQQSYSTPLGHMTTTSTVGKIGRGKTFSHKDTPQIMAATGIPYVFTAAESHPQDLLKKAAKAQWYAGHEGPVYGKLLTACPLNWKSAENLGTEIVKAAVETCFFPLYEVEHGETAITYNPEDKNGKKPVSEWLKLMGKSKHLLLEENADLLDEFQQIVDHRWMRLKAMHEHPLL